MKMPEDNQSVIKYSVADCIRIIFEKLQDPITTTREHQFLSNLLNQMLKFQIGDYGRN
jgi:hypothetical protein